MAWGGTVRKKITSLLFIFFLFFGINLKRKHASVAIFFYFDVLNMTAQHKAVTLLLILLEKSHKRSSVSVSNTQHKTNGLVNPTEVVVFSGHRAVLL